jgi:cytochrome b involved in lipid metabolism
MAINIIGIHDGEGNIQSTNMSSKTIPQHQTISSAEFTVDDEQVARRNSSSSSSSSHSNSVELDESILRYYTMKEIQNHNTEESAWIVAGEDIYNVTHYVRQHPGGKQSILKKTGGAKDCTQDLLFHSKNGRDMWKKYHIGKVTNIPSRNGQTLDKPWWMFWESL